MRACAAVVVVVMVLGGCAQMVPPELDRVSRLELNQAAARLDLPLFWRADDDGDGEPDPAEVADLLFYGRDARWVDGDRFTPEYEAALAAVVADVRGSGPQPPAQDAARRALVRQELDQGLPTLVSSDLRQLAPAHRAFAAKMLEVARLVDELYALQAGIVGLDRQIPADDPASRRLLQRNWSPRCVAPATEADPQCSAIPGAPPQVYGLYPAALQTDSGYCDRLAAEPNASDLLAPFTVVREAGDGFVAVPLSEAFAATTTALAVALEEAAAVMTDPAEEALRAYLRAAAAAFRSNDWAAADEAWSRMSARNSAWYVRVGPDEVYWERCSRKAGVHLTFARINPASLAWQDKLTPLRQEMEDGMAAVIGAPYQSRPVGFVLPDFIDIVVNAGDDRDALGGTIGQSLPNWGPVANEGRGRTVAMSNLFTDVDSVEARAAQAASLLSAETMAHYSSSPTPGLLSTILHEAAHNLGPAHEYRVGGQTDDELFGGGMASTLEELKAQSSALWLLGLLEERGVVDDELARQTWVDSIVWAFGHISRGMYTASGQRKAYSQLAAIQIGQLVEDGALVFDPAAMAANGRDRGAFTVDFARFPAAAERLVVVAGGIKARGDRAAAEALTARFVDGHEVPMATISERVLRFPRASLVYAVDLE